VKLAYDDVIKKLNLASRPEQKRFYEDALAAINDHETQCKVIGINATTGSGKTLGIALLALSANQPVIVSAPTYRVMHQIYEALNSVNATLNIKKAIQVRYGLNEFLSPERVSRYGQLAYSSDNEEEVALYDNLVVAAESDDPDNLIKNFKEEYGSLPFGLKDKDVCCNSLHSDSKWLASVNQLYHEADILVCSHMFLLSSMARRDYADRFLSGLFLIDEADALVQLSAQLSRSSLSMKKLGRLVGAIRGKSASKAFDGLLSVAQSECKEGVVINSQSKTFKALQKLLSSLSRYRSDVALELEEMLESFIQYAFGCQYYLFQDEGSIHITKRTAHSSRFVSRLCSKASKVVMLSGTLEVAKTSITPMQWLMKKFGWTCDDVGFFARYEPENFGSVEYVLGGPNYPAPMDRVDKQTEGVNLNPDFIGKTAKYVKSLLDGPVLVATASYEEANQIAAELESIGAGSRVVLDKRSERITDSAEAFLDIQDKAPILLTPKMSVGVDIRRCNGGQFIKNLVITRIPYSVPVSNEEIKAASPEYAEAASVMMQNDSYQFLMRKMVQTFGRLIRNGTDQGRITILDPRFPHYGTKEGMGYDTRLATLIPDQYRSAYIKAKILKPKTKSGSTLII